MSELGPERELALRLMGTARRRTALQSRIEELAGQVDYRELSRVLSGHWLLPLGATRLLAHAPDVVPGWLRTEAEETATSYRQRAMLADELGARLCRALEHDGIPAVRIKGTPLARRAHGDEGLRWSLDIDVLVPPAMLARAERVVEQSGYRPSAEPDWEAGMPLVHRSFESAHAYHPSVDLHWRVSWHDGGLSEAALGRSRVSLDGTRELLAADELAVLLLLYARDGFRGLRLAADVAAWWDALGSEVADGAVADLAASHPAAEPSLVAGCAALERLVGVPGGRLMAPLELRGPAAPAARLADWTAEHTGLAMAANLTLIDLLLTAPATRRSFFRRHLFQPAGHIAQSHGIDATAGRRLALRSALHGLAAFARLAPRGLAAMARVRGGRELRPLPGAAGAAGRGGVAGAAKTALKALLPGRYHTAVAGHLRALRHRGDAVLCPCCDRRFSHFAAHRGVPGIRCPRCGSLERHRLLALYFARRPELLAGGIDFLHFAPEYSLRPVFARHADLRYVSADLDSPMAEVHLDIADMPFPDRSFDALLCSHVLEHVPDDRAAMRELRRVLRPGGWAMVLIPRELSLRETFEDPHATSPEERLHLFKQEDHLRLYGGDFAQRLEEAGFAVSVSTCDDVLTPEDVERCRLSRGDEIYFCTVAATPEPAGAAPGRQTVGVGA